MRRFFQMLVTSSLFPKMAVGAYTKPHVGLDGNSITISNDFLTAKWEVVKGVLYPHSLKNNYTGASLILPEAFTLEMEDGSILRPSEMIMERPPARYEITPNPASPKLSDQLGGELISIPLVNSDKTIRVVWQIILHRGSHYLRQQITISAIAQDAQIHHVVLIDASIEGAEISGTVKGCPITTPQGFYAFEHPLTEQRLELGGNVSSYLLRKLPLKAGQSVTYSSVVGLVRPGQMRRDFATYVERERAHPYRPFLHYNTWYDIGFSDIPFKEEDALNVIKTLGDKGLPLQSFLMDDGWDNPETLWGFHDGFPEGFKNVAALAHQYGAGVGAWMSPWGGYGNEKVARMNFGRAQGFEMNDGGFALSGPQYYKRFRDTCLNMIRQYGVNQFKLDGMGNINSAIEGSLFDSDFDAAMSLIEEIRLEKSDIYINLTYGTFPSPFWLQYADSIWRGGKDHEFTGQGTKRQQWINYRDGDTYTNVVSKSKLFPLNSLMLHGIIFAQHTHNLKNDPFGDFDGEVHSFFGSGTQLQELYITPSLLHDRHWQALREGSEFAVRHATALRDTHWIGGDPNKSEVYGWAGWQPQESVITLRNPSGSNEIFTIDVAQHLELASDAPTYYQATSQWEKDMPPIALQAGIPTQISLKPFEVKTLILTPQA